MGIIKYIDEVDIKNKRVLLRVDFNVSLNKDHTIANDERLRQAIPTIEYLLKNNNRLIIVSHLGRPKDHEPAYSLSPVAKRLATYLNHSTYITLIDNFLKQDKETFANQDNNTIFLLENIRYFPEEQEGDVEFAKELSALADVYVNDAFGVSHRPDASVVSVTKFLPSYGGLLLKKEVENITHTTQNPDHPFVAIIGGAKISTKLKLLDRLTEIADQLIVGGGLANTFLAALGFKIGKSICEESELEASRRLFYLAAEKHTTILLPIDVRVGKNINDSQNVVKDIESVEDDDMILDIGPQTQEKYKAVIAESHTVVWNGPVGYFENPAFRMGTDGIYESIVENTHLTSIVGGGDTINAIAHEKYLDHITHISTGGGAMLELIEKGTLPGLEALKNE